jgi:hypothetical protein
MSILYDEMRECDVNLESKFAQKMQINFHNDHQVSPPFLLWKEKKKGSWGAA